MIDSRLDFMHLITSNTKENVFFVVFLTVYIVYLTVCVFVCVLVR